MLAENLVDIHRPLQQDNAPDRLTKISDEGANEDRLEGGIELEAGQYSYSVATISGLMNLV